jgi:hypothetical protein
VPRWLHPTRWFRACWTAAGNQLRPTSTHGSPPSLPALLAQLLAALSNPDCGRVEFRARRFPLVLGFRAAVGGWSFAAADLNALDRWVDEGRRRAAAPMHSA